VTSIIQTANGGTEALSYLKGEGKYSDRDRYGYPDFVVTDLKMPGVDGFGVLEFLRRRNSTITPTCILSGSADSDDIKSAYLLGANAYHAKPCAPTELRALVKTLHDYWMFTELPEPQTGDEEWEIKNPAKLGERFFRQHAD